MSLLDFLFPKKCLGCGKKGQYFCEACVDKIELISRPICPICVKPSPFGRTHPRCQTRFTINGLTSVFVYQGVIREAIKQLKYNFRFDLAEELVTILLNRNVVNSIQFLDFEKTVVVPVPLHRWRQDWRGFNQSVLLAKILAEKLDLSFCQDLLVRKRYTQPQTGLKKEERKENVEDAFKINEEYLKTSVNQQATPKLAYFAVREYRQAPSWRMKRTRIKADFSKRNSQPPCWGRLYSCSLVRPPEEDFTKEGGSRRPNSHKFARGLQDFSLSSVLLLDDVWTTGATMRTCSNLLKRAGFKKVWGLTVAR